MYECKRIAVIQRGKSGNCFPAEICEGESARSCEARVFPPRAPPFRARSCCMLWKCEYVLVGRWILRCWQCNVTPIYTQVESAELMTHPTYGKTLYISP